MANYYLHEDGSIDKNKKKVMERNQSRATIEKEKARKELIQARTQYNNYLQQETQKILNTPQPQAPQDVFSQRRTQLQDLTSRNVRQPINNVSPFNRINQFEQQASRNAQAIREASSTDRAKVLRESMTQKQNTYNLKNYMKNVEDVDRQNVSTFSKITNPIVSGALDLVDPTRLTGTTTYYDDEGNRTFLPNKRELRQQKVREESTGAVGVYNDLAYNMSKAVTSGVINMFVPGAGKILYYGNIVDSGVDEAKRQGFSDSEALAYGSIMGIVAGTLDTALDTFGGLSTFTQGKIPTLTQGVDKFFYKIIGNKTLSRLLSNVSREALSEFTEEYVDNIAKYMINADASDADSFLDMLSKTWNDATYSALVGGLSGGVGGVIETNTEETRERIKALEDYKKTLESIQPQSPIEAQYKNDEINKVDNQLQNISDNPQVAKYQQELASVEQEKQQLTSEPTTQETTQETTQTRTQEPQSQKQVATQTTKDAINIPDEDITSKVFNNSNRNAESETETSTYEISNEYEEPIRTVSKQMNLTNKTTNNTIKDIRSIENTKNQTPVENLNSDDITITKKGISTNLSEKMVDDVLKITTPTEKPKTITISDKENTYKVKTPSAEVASKDMSEQVGMYYDNLSSDEKREIYRETKKKNTVFERGQEYAEKTGDKDLTNAMKSVEEQAYYNQLDIKANLLNNIIDTYKDVNARAESFNKDYLRLSAGTLDGTNLEVSNEVVAKGQGLAIYYLDNHMPKEATDVLLKLGKLGTASGQASAQFNAMYQYTPYGIYTQTVKDMQQAYNEMASRKSPNWAKKNNPETNPNSRFRLTTEQTDYILKESSELHRLHSTDFKEYSIRKGKLQNYIADLIPHGFSEGLGNWVRSSLLLGTRTVFKNYGSNVIDTSYHAVNKINYSIYDLGLNKVFGTDIRVAGISLNGSKAGLKAGVQTSVQSLQDIIKGTNTTEFSNRYSDASTSRENITKDFFDTMPTRYQTKIKPLNAVGNWVSQLANNTMTWGDAKFAAASYEDNRVTLRKMNALEQFEKNSSKPIVYNYKTDKAGTTHIDYINTEGKYAYVTTNDTLDNFMKQNNMNLLENGDKIDKIALEYAQSRTYTSDTTFSKVTSSIINTIDKAAAKTPILKQTGIKPSNFIIPFSKIGSNLCYKMYRGSFLSIPSVVSSFQNFKAEVDDGNLSMQTQYDLVSRLGDLTTGTILYAVMGSLAKAAFDNVEGDEDDDEQSKVKKFMQSVFGKDKYSFKVGDFNFSFDVGGNLTNMLKLSLDLQQTNEKEEATFRDYTETTFKDILSEWTVSNLTDLFNEQYNSNALDNILQTIARIPSMVIPTFMKDVAMNIDNFTERSIWDEDLGTYALNNIKAKIPPIGPLKDISRSTLPEKTDSWQNTMKAGSDLFTNIWNTYLVGGQIKKDKSDSVSDELMNIYLITQKTSVIPNVNKNSFTYDKVKYDLTDEEERKYLKTYATTAHNKLDKLFSSKTYQETDTETKLKYIEEIYTYANDEAKKEYLKGKGIEYYNYGKQVLILGKNDTFKQSQVLDAIDNNISYNAARSYQEDSQKFKFYQSFGSYEKYEAIDDNISDIKTTYSTKNGFTTNQRKNTVVNYVNSLNNLSAIQKAILIKQQYPSLYKSYDEKIKQYLKQQNLDEETYNALLSKMKIK